MKEFNYQDFLYYQKLKQQELLKLREPHTPYQLDTINIDKPHDKLFKIILSEKKEVTELLNRVLLLEKKLVEEDIERYSTEHINYMFQKSESDIIYKMKHKEIFFLIEHQRTIDYNMPKRILDYEVEIIKEATKGKKMTKKHHKLPTVIPIVIYTGNRKWNVEQYIKECQDILEGADTIKLGDYYVVDANNYNNEELENDKFFFPKMLLLEKLSKEEDIINVLNRIVKIEKDEDNRNLLKRVIAFIMREKLPPSNIEKLLKNLESEEKDMVAEVLQKENERQRKIGIQQGIRTTAKKMLEFGMTLNDIEKITGLTKEKIKKL